MREFWILYLPEGDVFLHHKHFTELSAFEAARALIAKGGVSRVVLMHTVDQISRPAQFEVERAPIRGGVQLVA